MLIPITLALVLSASGSSPPATSVIWGMGRAKDGDSLMVGETEVRLFGIDAPEFDQACGSASQANACGMAAAKELSRLVTGREVRCEIVSKDQYGRSLGRCSVGTTDLNRTLVLGGYATAYRRYSSDYVPAEESAKAAKRGIWSGTFQAPEAYRHQGDLDQPSSRSRPSVSRPRASFSDRTGRAKANCNIKGNRNRRGEWIYHLPGMPYYEQTRAEDFFCTEAEAQAAGYRRAIVRR